MKFGLYRTQSSIANLARDIAEQLGIPSDEFKASRHWVSNFAKRHNMVFRYPTTKKSQTIYSYLAAWQPWINSVRLLCRSLGLVTPGGYIKGWNCYNIDEFGIKPGEGQYKHLVRKDALMVNTQHLKLGLSTDHRTCTGTVIVPKSGFTTFNSGAGEEC